MDLCDADSEHNTFEASMTAATPPFVFHIPVFRFSDGRKVSQATQLFSVSVVQKLIAVTEEVR